MNFKFETPFGISNKRSIYSPGIHLFLNKNDDLVAVKLYKKTNSLVPKHLFNKEGWYKGDIWEGLKLYVKAEMEDIEWLKSKNNLRENNPVEFKKQFGVFVLPTKETSKFAYDSYWQKKLADCWVEVECYPNENGEDILLKCSLGRIKNSDNFKYFVVSNQQYENERHEFGFICNPDIHEEHEIVIS